MLLQWSLKAGMALEVGQDEIQVANNIPIKE